jgi:peptidoglycan/LPS O-acetylase OafA/YrhL
LGTINRMGRESEKHIESLDGLRGIAILLVFFFHYLTRNPYNPLSWFASLGWSGVDLFFVLSGFLITGILYDTRESTNFFRVFYTRRALRLFPVYFLAVGIVLSAAALLHTPMSWKALPFYIYGANIMLGLRDGVPNFGPYFQCVHFWSLSLEEQFYSLWPLVIFFVRKRRTMMVICAGGIIGALLFRIVLTHLRVSTWILYTELPSRMDSLLAGALLALALRGPRADAWRNRRRLYLLMATFCLILSLLFIRARSAFFASPEVTSWGYSMFAGLYACVLALALVPGTVPYRIGRLSVLRFFGRYSYGLYIWHDLPSPVCVSWQAWFVGNIHPPVLAQAAYTLAMLTLFTAVAMLSYHLLERRFLMLKSRFQYSKSKDEHGGQRLPKLQIADDAPTLH